MPRFPEVKPHPRYPVHKVVSYHHSGKQFLTLTQDLGIDGMRIETHYHLPTDEELTFNLILGKTIIGSKGRVVRSELLTRKRTVSDIEFTKLSEQDLATLRNYLATLEKWPKPRGMLSTRERRSIEPRSREAAEE
jgi:hypothetical protein